MSYPALERLATHPAVQAVRARQPRPPATLTAADLKALALAAGADDAAAVSLDHPDLAEERPYVLEALPGAKSLICLVQRLHAPNLQSPRRSIANTEFHQVGDQVDAIAQNLAKALTAKGHRTINPAMAFPMEMAAFPGRTWTVAHKRVAVAAGLGQVGLHRNVIHPVFGSFILLATVISEAPVSEAPAPLAFNPCFDCKLCVAACPVGAIEPDGAFRFSACLDHNYREFMTGFSDLLEDVADSKNRQDLRDRLPLNDTMSMWQSLAYKPNYKAAYCIAVCPAGEDHLAPFLTDRAGYLATTVKPLTAKRETIYVVAGSDAEAHVRRRFPHKTVRQVRSSLRPTSVAGFFESMHLLFQRGPATGWAATYHFDLSGPEATQVTVRLADGTLTVTPGLIGSADIRVRADGQTWLDIVSKKRHPVVAVLTGKLKVTGNPALLNRFAACFPR